jgi:2-polyprenyl-3-methyl-5-hydroxy-6-metoxy-1,4-benzoquinol methylase
MNRKARRAALSRGKAAAGQPLPGEMTRPDQIMAQARQLYQQRQFAAAEQVCRHILAREPTHGGCHNLLGLIAQASGQHARAVRSFAKAIATDPESADWRYNLAASYETLGHWDRAIAHYARAIALDAEGGPTRRLLLERPVIAGALQRTMRSWPQPLSVEEMFGAAGSVAIAGDALLHCALNQVWLCNAPLELMLTGIRAQLLRDAVARAPDFAGADEKTIGLFGAIAQQCFINDYVYAQSDAETTQANELRGLLCDRLKAGAAIAPLLLAAVAAYCPLHTLPDAQSLLRAGESEPLGDLLRRQVREPLEEQQDRANIPVLTPIDDPVSVAVRQQYEESPYPRWTMIPWVQLTTPDEAQPTDPADILIAGCGTGKHAIDAALRFPQARVLAIDISLASLAYARRKSREAGLTRIEYAQADIMQLASLDRCFDRIESIGVLHHLGDPKAGLRVLASLLHPDGVLEIALYSEIARRAIVAARARIAERGYPPTPSGIRSCRQEILRARDGSLEKSLTALRDFYGTSGCRDLLFNVMEHRFTLPQIKALLDELHLALVDFEVAPEILARFRSAWPVADANDLDRWHAFETAHPDTFLEMYQLLVRPQRPSA